MKGGIRISYKSASELKKTMTTQEYEEFKKRIIANMDYQNSTEEEKELLLSYHLQEDE